MTTDEGCQGNQRGKGQACSCPACAPEIPEAAYEAAAKAACEAAYPPSPTGRVKAHDSWDEIEEWERDAWRATVKAALAAALPHATFTSSEVKELTETATRLGVALGRKEAGEEIAAAIENNHGWPTRDQKKALDLAATIARNIAYRDLPSQPQEAVSNGPTVPSGHSGLPPTPEAARDAKGDS